MEIECNNIISEAEILKSKFQKCKTLNSKDLRRIIDLITSLKNCVSESSDGLNGADGLDGLSAYQQALNQGFVGNESQWIDSLKGSQGIKGDSGDKGEKGDAGITGNGILSITKTSTAGLVDNYSILFTNGLSTNFSIKNGENGLEGLDGIDGKSAYQVAIEQGFIGSEADWLLSLKGIPGINSSNNLQRNQLSSFIISDSDNNFVIQLKNETDIIITVPNSGLRNKFNCGFSRLGVGEVSFISESGVVIFNAINGFMINRTGDPVYLERDGINQFYTLYGNTKVTSDEPV